MPPHARTWLAALASLALGGFSGPAAAGAQPAPQFAISWIAHPDAHGEEMQIRAGVLEPEGTAVSEILYLPGFADRFDNHPHLLGQLAAAGHRIISFDYPAHGETGGNLDEHPIADLSHIAHTVVEKLGRHHKLPLLLAGWSIGGLLAVRIAQEQGQPDTSFTRWHRPPAGLVLLAPSVAPRTMVGKNGFVTDSTLSSHPQPPRAGPTRPQAPVQALLFGVSLLHHAELARNAALPTSLPVLLIVGGQHSDRYVKSDDLIGWAELQRTHEVALSGLACAGAYHELDNEPEPIGSQVRRAVVAFASAAARPGTAMPSLPQDACMPF